VGGDRRYGSCIQCHTATARGLPHQICRHLLTKNDKFSSGLLPAVLSRVDLKSRASSMQTRCISGGCVKVEVVADARRAWMD